MKKEVVITASDTEIEEIIKQVYGIDYSICAAEEAGNGDNLDYNIDGKMDEFERRDAQQAIEGELYRTRDLMQDLCFHGRLEPGRYIVSIFW